MIKKLLGLVIGAALVVATLPNTMATFNTANTTGFTAMQTAMWTIVGVVIMVAFIYLIVEEFL